MKNATVKRKWECKGEEKFLSRLVYLLPEHLKYRYWMFKKKL